jgi:beta-phosphoglucomutase-like phosphatase (HAD superfamily)
MDGVVLDSADHLPRATNEILAKYGHPELPWSVRTQMVGRSRPEVVRILQEWTNLPITAEEFLAERAALQRIMYASVQPVPGVARLLFKLDSTKIWDEETAAMVGVQGARRAGMRALWLPHPLVKERHKDRVQQVLTGTTGDTASVDIGQSDLNGDQGEGWGGMLH